MNFKKPGFGTLVLSALVAVAPAGADEIADRSKPLNVEFERADRDLSQYARLLIREIDVSETKIVSPPWVGDAPFRWEVSEKNLERLQEAFMNSMRTQIMDNGGYQLVSERGVGVLELRLKIVSFMPYAEQKDKAVTRGSGEMVIHVETRDAQTGELLGVYEGPQDVGRDYQANSDFTRKENLTQLFDAWGRRIRIALDEDHGR